MTWGGVVRRLAFLGGRHSWAMGQYLAGIDAAVARGDAAQQGWDAARQAINDRISAADGRASLEALHRDLMSGIGGAVPRVLADPQLSEQVRAGVRQLAVTCAEMRSALEYPRDIETFRNRTRELRADFSKHCETLKVLLGLDDLE
jgi:hypothetical protein